MDRNIKLAIEQIHVSPEKKEKVEEMLYASFLKGEGETSIAKDHTEYKYTKGKNINKINKYTYELKHRKRLGTIAVAVASFLTLIVIVGVGVKQIFPHHNDKLPGGADLLEPTTTPTVIPSLRPIYKDTPAPYVSPEPSTAPDMVDPDDFTLDFWHTAPTKADIQPPCIEQVYPSEEWTSNQPGIWNNAITLKGKFAAPKQVTQPIYCSLDGSNTLQAISYINGTLIIDDTQYNISILDETPVLDSFYLIDIDQNDSYIELVFEGDGPSGDPSSFFFRYENKQLIGLGVLNSSVSTMTFNNEGGIHCKSVRWDVLQTSWIQCDWRLVDRNLELSIQNYYKFADYEMELFLIEEITIYQDPSITSETSVLKPQKISFIQSDLLSWIQVMGEEDNVIGWIRYSNYSHLIDSNKSADEVFEGLNYAD